MKHNRQSKYYKTEGIVLKGMPLGDRDRLISLYTQDYGRVRLVARGIRKISSKLSGHLDTFNRVFVSISSRSSIDSISGGEVVETFKELKTDLKITARAFYIVELIDDFVADGSVNEELYSLLLTTLRELDLLARSISVGSQRVTMEEDVELLMRFFELNLLIDSGYAPELSMCVVCNQPLSTEGNGYSVEMGGLVGQTCYLQTKAVQPISVAAIKCLRFLSGAKIRVAQKLRINPVLMSEIQMILQKFTMNINERKISARQLIDSINTISEGKQ